jgi:hypothetical protein
MKTKKKTKAKAAASEYRFIDSVLRDVPGAYELAASLMPFDDVITDQWCDKKMGCIGIGFDIDQRVCPSGVHSHYGASIYGDGHVVLFHDMTMTDGRICREEYSSDMHRLWALLRQIPRPVSSFGEWKEND